MQIRYYEHRDDQSREERLEELFRFFSYLLMKTSGDVDETLDWIEEIDKSHGILGDLTMQEFVDELKKAGLIEPDKESGDQGSRFSLTGRGRRKLRTDALDEIFSSLKKSTPGDHRTPQTGSGHEETGELRSWSFGDRPSSIDPTASLTNAFRREADIEQFRLREEDLRVRETEASSSVATVLMIDISHSMILYGEDRITPAKQVALALSELVMTRYPKDRLQVLLFGDDATEIGVAEIPFVSVGPYHTNTRAGLKMARSMLRRSRNSNRQIFMITDGKPSAMYDESGRLYKNSFGLDPRIVNRTLDEAVACRREGITISTFMVAQDSWLVEFVEDMTKANRGRAYYTGLGDLGEMLLVDYMRGRKRRMR